MAPRPGLEPGTYGLTETQAPQLFPIKLELLYFDYYLYGLFFLCVINLNQNCFFHNLQIFCAQKS